MLHTILHHYEQTRAQPDSRREQLGHLALLISPSVDRPYANYAWPAVEEGHIDTVHIDIKDITEVARRFREANRQPRFEYPAEVAPALGLLLDEQGYIEARHMPLMALRWPSRVVLPGGLEITNASTLVDLRAHIHVYHLGFEIEPPTDLDEMLELRYEEIRQGKRLFLTASLYGVPIATAQLILSDDSAEIVGVTTLKTHRQKGVGAAITHGAVLQAQQHGVQLIFLASANEQASRVYRKLGFQEVGTSVIWVADE